MEEENNIINFAGPMSYHDAIKQADAWLASNESECDDCGTTLPNDELAPWKYEPGYKLCEGCFDDRMIEDEREGE